MRSLFKQMSWLVWIVHSSAMHAISNIEQTEPFSFFYTVQRQKKKVALICCVRTLYVPIDDFKDWITWMHVDCI